MSGLAPLRYSEIAAWSRLTGQTVRPWEVEALVQIDGVMLFPDAERDDE